METLIFSLLLLLVGAGVWFVQRLRHIRALAMAREAAALEALLAASHTRTPLATGEVVDTTELDSAREAVSSATPPTSLVRRVPISPVSREIGPIPSHERVVPPMPTSARVQPAGDVPLRSLVLAWFAARGYRLRAAPSAAWPIEGVLAHIDSSVRCYAWVVQSERVSLDRITVLLEQAAAFELQRVVLVAENGADPGVRENARQRHVRLIDRAAMQAELATLPRETAACIVAAARSRWN